MSHRLTTDERQAVLQTAPYLVLGLTDATGTVTTTPLTYVWDATTDSFLLHGSSAGHLMQQLATRPTVSATIVADTQVDVPDFTMAYRSVTIAGTIEPVTETETITATMRAVCTKYLGADYDRAHFNRTLSHLATVLVVYRLVPTTIMGLGHDL